MNDPVVSGNILTVFRENLVDTCAFAAVKGIETFSVVPEGDGFQISFPITKEIEANLPGMLHGARARLKKAEQEAKEALNTDPEPPRRA